jgi:hypothetical protein
MNDYDALGELRSALARVQDGGLEHVGEVAFVMAMARVTLEHPDLFEAMTRMTHEALSPMRSGHASAWDRVEFVIEAAPALAARVADEAPWVLDPARAACTWLAGLCWQMTHHYPTNDVQECVHVYMGLGGGKEIRLLWDIETRGWFRYVLVGTGFGGVGDLLTHGAMKGWPGLPAHQAFGPAHIDSAAAEVKRREAQASS